MKQRSYTLLAGACAVALAAAAATRAFDGEVIAIRGGTVVPVTGAAIPNGVVVIRDGLIAAVGANVPIPADARVIDATGMTVYPGLFDTYTSLGLPTPTPSPGGQLGGNRQAQLAFVAAEANNPNTPSGLAPEVSAATQLKIAPETFDQQRSVGITTALSAPRTGIYQGQSVLLNLGGEAPEKLILKSPATLNVGFSGGRFGSYPGSLMGVFAFLRQSLLDAQYYRDQWSRYNREKRGVVRPQVDPSLAALQPVINGELLVIFQANSVREIKRAIGLAEELKLKYLIAGGAQSYEIADLLKQKGATVLLSLNYPQRPAGLEDPESESLRVLRQRAEAPKAAAVLHKAGVRFAFQSGYLARPQDYLANAARAIEAGLPKEIALKALTIYPAEIFGLAEQLGSIEPGKIANLVATSGELFDRNTKVKYVFVDGRQYEVKAEPPPGAGRGGPGGRAGMPPPTGANAPETAVAAGVWMLTVESPNGPLQSTLSLQQNGDALSGEITTPLGNSAINRGRLSGTEVTLEFTLEIQGQATPVAVHGLIEGQTMRGTITTAGQSFNFTGARTPR